MQYWLTFYCSCAICCGPSSPERGGHGLAANRKKPIAWQTVAAPRWIPFGTVLRLDVPKLGWRNRAFVVTDRTAKPTHPTIDVFIGANHDQAKHLGKHKVNISK